MRKLSLKSLAKAIDVLQQTTFTSARAFIEKANQILGGALPAYALVPFLNSNVPYKALLRAHWTTCSIIMGSSSSAYNYANLFRQVCTAQAIDIPMGLIPEAPSGLNVSNDSTKLWNSLALRTDQMLKDYFGNKVYDALYQHFLNEYKALSAIQLELGPKTPEPPLDPPSL